MPRSYHPPKLPFPPCGQRRPRTRPFFTMPLSRHTHCALFSGLLKWPALALTGRHTHSRAASLRLLEFSISIFFQVQCPEPTDAAPSVAGELGHGTLAACAPRSFTYFAPYFFWWSSFTSEPHSSYKYRKILEMLFKLMEVMFAK